MDDEADMRERRWFELTIVYGSGQQVEVSQCQVFPADPIAHSCSLKLQADTAPAEAESYAFSADINQLLSLSK